MSKRNLRTDMTKVRHIAAAAAICAAGYILQCTLCGRIALGSVRPNLLIILTVCVGSLYGRTGGMLAGFFLGLASDVQFGTVTGLYALIYMLIGSADGMARQRFCGEDIKRTLTLVGISALIYGMTVYLLTFMLRGEFDFIYYLMNIIIPETLYTVIAAVFACPLIFRALGHKRP